jgi:predicted ATP-binding protein involved in virulence
VIENNEQTELQTPPPAYFGSLTIENVKCFKGKHTIDLSDKNGNPALWTVILGDNNTGKTTLLRCLADLQPILINKNNNNNECIPKILSKYKKINTNKNLSLPFYYGVSCCWYIKNIQSLDWGISAYFTEYKIPVNYGVSDLGNKSLANTIIYGYGTSRKMGKTALSESENQDNTASLFDDSVTLVNTEEWLLQTFFAVKLEKPNAAKTLERIKTVLTSGILPDVKDFRFDTTPDFKGFVEVETDYGWIKLRELGYGYQTTLAWIVDLAKKLFERYPNSENPLHEPAIVLIDELDLHLHPEWQRKIIKFLSEQFPKTQFIATTHSPLIVQSADNINLILLEKEEDHVIIKQPDLTTYKGWTIEEILDELMGLGENTVSDSYLEYMEEFGQALDEENYYKAKSAYNKLDKILHPASHQRKLLRLQMSGLIPETVENNHD